MGGGLSRIAEFQILPPDPNRAAAERGGGAGRAGAGAPLAPPRAGWHGGPARPSQAPHPGLPWCNGGGRGQGRAAKLAGPSAGAALTPAAMSHGAVPAAMGYGDARGAAAGPLIMMFAADRGAPARAPAPGARLELRRRSRRTGGSAPPGRRCAGPPLRPPEYRPGDGRLGGGPRPV
jgi:hypothetical protein